MKPFSALLCIVAACLLAPLAALPAADAPKQKPNLLVNIAADGLVDCLPLGKPIEEVTSARELVEAYHGAMDRYAGTRVTHVMLNPNYQRAAYASKAWESYWDVADPEKAVTGWPRGFWHAHRLGVDPFAVCIARCREKGLSPWLSLRMNDMHYSGERDKMSRLWWEHPELRLAPKSGFDFAASAVREHYLALLAELLERYDCDGLELDWMRFPPHVKAGSPAEGGRILGDFMRAARRLTTDWSARRKHPVGLATRVPAVPETAIALGLDGAAWAREGLVDILVVTSTWTPLDFDIPMDRWREALGPAAGGVMLAAGADLFITAGPSCAWLRNDLESARGFAAASLDRGAGALYLFNHFNKDKDFNVRSPDGKRILRNDHRAIMDGIGDLNALLACPRRHVLTYDDTTAPGVPNPKQLPAVLASAAPLTLRIHTGPEPAAGRAVLRLGLDDLPEVAEARLRVRMNGAACLPLPDMEQPAGYRRDPKSPEVWLLSQVARRLLQFDVPLTAINRGDNSVDLSLENGPQQKIIWAEMYLDPGSTATDRRVPGSANTAEDDPHKPKSP